METTSAIVCDPAIAIAEDRTMFYLKAGFHMIADDRRPYCDQRSAIIWKPAFNKGNEKFTVVCSCSPKNLEFGHFKLLLCRGRRGNVLKFKTQGQSDCFLSLNLFFCGVVVAIVIVIALDFSPERPVFQHN